MLSQGPEIVPVPLVAVAAALVVAAVVGVALGDEIALDVGPAAGD
jgi:hypothetical protein